MHLTSKRKDESYASHFLVYVELVPRNKERVEKIAKQSRRAKFSQNNLHWQT